MHRNIEKSFSRLNLQRVWRSEPLLSFCKIISKLYFQNNRVTRRRDWTVPPFVPEVIERVHCLSADPRRNRNRNAIVWRGITSDRERRYKQEGYRGTGTKDTGVINFWRARFFGAKRGRDASTRWNSGSKGGWKIEGMGLGRWHPRGYPCPGYQGLPITIARGRQTRASKG